MHQPVNCGNYQDKLAKLKERLEAIELLVAFTEANSTSATGQTYALNAKTALREIRSELI